MAETLSVTDMLPNKFEPKRKFRWVFACEGIDAFRSFRVCTDPKKHFARYFSGMAKTFKKTLPTLQLMGWWREHLHKTKNIYF